MSTLYKRGRYWWYARGGGPGRFQISTRSTNLRTARTIQQKLDDEYALNRFNIIFPGKELSLATLIKEWIKFARPNQRNMISIKLFCDFIGDPQIRAIQTKNINEFVRARNKAPYTIKNDLSALRQLFNYALDNNYILHNPVLNAIKPKYKILSPRQALPINKVQEILEQAFSDEKIFWNLCYYTGLSPVDSGTLIPAFVQNSVIHRTRTKTNVPAPIPLHRKLIEFGNRIYNTMPRKSDRDRSNRHFKEISDGQVLYTLRHSFASHLVDLGAPYMFVKILMGHKSDDITLNYVHNHIDEVRKWINLLQ